MKRQMTTGRLPRSLEYKHSHVEMTMSAYEEQGPFVFGHGTCARRNGQESDSQDNQFS